MTTQQPQGPSSPPPQNPFDLWRTRPSRRPFPFLWVFLFLALVVLFGSGFWYRARDFAQNPAVPRAKDPLDGQPDALSSIREAQNSQIDEIVRNDNPFTDRMDRAVGIRPPGRVPGPALDPETARRASDAERRRKELDAKAAQRGALDAGARAREAMTRWRSELDRWDALSSKLLDGDEGRPVAGGGEFVRQFRTALRADRPSAGEYEQARQGLEMLLAPVEKAVNDPADLLQPGPQLSLAIDSYLSRANRAAGQWKDAVQEMNALAFLARRRGLTATMTLRQAIGDLETEMAAQRLEEKNAKLADAEKKASRSDAEIEAAKVAIAADLRKGQAEDAKKKLRDDAERLRKREFARGDEVRKYLGSLMEKGFTQPVPFGRWASAGKAAEEGPVSLSALRRSGCLDKGIDGQIGLVGFMTHYQMDRTRWGMPDQAIQWNADQQRFVVRAQQLLNEYGEALVEEGLLAK